jgi:hypothetical protein
MSQPCRSFRFVGTTSDSASWRVGSGRTNARLCDPASMSANPETADQRATVDAIVRRARNLTPAERRRLGRWTSSSLRDPRISPKLEAAREKAIEVLDRDRDRRKRWEATSRPLHEALVEATRDARRWRIVMLACHLAALLAIVNVPGGMPPLIALAITLSAPLSAWAAWGSGIGWLGAIHAALASAVEDRLDADERDRLGQAWYNAIEADPPVAPPFLGALNALAPSALLVVALFVVVWTSTPR